MRCITFGIQGYVERVASKTTTSEKEHRINEIYKKLLEGASRPAIIHYSSNSWGVSTRATDEYIKQARQRMQSDLDSARQTAMAEHLAARRKLRYEANMSGDNRLVLDVLRDEAKLLSLYDSELLQRVEQLERSVTDNKNSEP